MHSRHEDISLKPTNEELFARNLIVAVTSDHIRKNKRVTVQVDSENIGDDCDKTIAVTPVGVFIYYTDEYWKVLSSGKKKLHITFTLNHIFFLIFFILFSLVRRQTVNLMESDDCHVCDLSKMLSAVEHRIFIFPCLWLR